MNTDFIQTTSNELIKRYGVVLSLDELAEALKMPVRIVRSRLKRGVMSINYQKEGTVFMIPAIEVANYLHYPKMRLEREKKNFIFG
ncbi:MAG: DNA-directed RNA polymerase specialized sigma24 family protein [Alteromonadaceae bacterium]|jgi:DNA-directed RNA polymerase specialized sigma24 family protein